MMERRDLPKGWAWKKLKTLITVNYGKGLSEKLRLGGNVPVYGANGVVGFHNASITKGQTIVIGRKGSAGAVNWSEIACWPIDTTFFIDEFPEILYPKFLYQFLRSQQIDRLQQSAAIPGLNRDVLYSVQVPIPYPDDPARSLAEQRRIAARLETLLGEARALRAEVQSMRRDLAQVMESALAEAFPAPQGEAAEGWGWKKVSEIVEIHDRGRIPIKESQRIAGNTPYCGANGIIDYVDGYTHEGDFVLLAEDGGNFKGFEQSAYLMSGKFWANNHVHVLRGKEKLLDSKYLYFVLYFSDLTPYLTGATRPKLTQSALQKIIIPIPYPNDPARSLAEQRRIVASLERIAEETRALDASLAQDLRDLEALEQSILAAAFRGEV